MKRILTALETLNALAPGYEVTMYGRGDWSLYRDGFLVCNALRADFMLKEIRSLIKAAKQD